MATTASNFAYFLQLVSVIQDNIPFFLAIYVEGFLKCNINKYKCGINKMHSYTRDW